jgi:NAD(P)-dependent dehydrogenase (short-subunit alcohol dehydrogenase family)
MPTKIDMTNKAALVTGAASGLGRATALALGRVGADLYLVDVNAAGLEETVRDVRALGARAEPFVTDLADPENCRAAVARAVETFGQLYALCNVAGLVFLANTHEMPAAQFEKTLAVNLKAPFYLIQAAIPHLLKTDGAVVNVTSTASFVGEAYAVAYCATKAGLTHMTKALAMEYIHQPIRFNAVAPGGMMTNIGANFSIPEGADISLIQRYSGIRGMVEVEDVADTVAFLASPASRGYHGACLTIDKGITAG